MTPVQQDQFAAQLAVLREEHDRLTTTVATKQAVLLDLEQRTVTLAARREDATARVHAAEERLASLQDQLVALLAALPALQTDLAALVRAAVAEALDGQLERAVKTCLARLRVPQSKQVEAQVVLQEARKP